MPFQRFEPLENGLEIGSIRDKRAARFANMVVGLVRDYVPGDRDCQRLIHDHIWRLAAEQNLEIIAVPPECDALDSVQLAHRMLEAKLSVIPPILTNSMAQANVAETASLRGLLNEAVELLPTHDGLGDQRCELAAKIRTALEKGTVPDGDADAN